MLKIGDEVYLSDEGIKSYLDEGVAQPENPIGVKGLVSVYDINDFELTLCVEWGNGHSNNYAEEDLIKVTQEKPAVIGYNRVWRDGSLGRVIMGKLAVSKVVAQKRGSICIHENGKQKFRPVYEV